MDSFNFNQDFYQACLDCGNEKAAKDLAWAILRYAFEGEGTPEDYPSGAVRASFRVAQGRIDAARAAATAGKRGGRPKGDKQETPLSENDAKNTPNKKRGVSKKGGQKENPPFENEGVLEKGGFSKNTPKNKTPLPTDRDRDRDRDISTYNSIPLVTQPNLRQSEKGGFPNRGEPDELLHALDRTTTRP